MEIPKPYRETRPWGEELWLTKEAPSMVKILTINPGEFTSLQFHHKRDEFWHVISGNGVVEIDGESVQTFTGDNHFVAREVKHRLRGGNEPLVLLEIIYGVFDENDIVRIEDKYGRR